LPEWVLMCCHSSLHPPGQACTCVMGACACQPCRLRLPWPRRAMFLEAGDFADALLQNLEQRWAPLGAADGRAAAKAPPMPGPRTEGLGGRGPGLGSSQPPRAGTAPALSLPEQRQPQGEQRQGRWGVPSRLMAAALAEAVATAGGSLQLPPPPRSAALREGLGSPTSIGGSGSRAGCFIDPLDWALRQAQALRHGAAHSEGGPGWAGLTYVRLGSRRCRSAGRAPP
jgi:hypothetical protein